ncbi:hypothetical protein VCHA37P193_30063 [Vibrio chagasii]|nr:hypothetical protein VCHA37P193_30063 [Vibrio chagasii]
MLNGVYLIKSVKPLIFRGFIIEVSRNEYELHFLIVKVPNDEGTGRRTKHK